MDRIESAPFCVFQEDHFDGKRRSAASRMGFEGLVFKRWKRRAFIEANATQRPRERAPAEPRHFAQKEGGR
ncbi:hypothetical protein ACNJX9_34065 [Bradyrhizobium sp. DASA03076]|uniref:hypothetical protein n=1 Tax=Bradyrhizobium sp. BLXBL-03 TaxID=3395916 RepID=UPI003F70A1C5